MTDYRTREISWNNPFKGLSLKGMFSRENPLTDEQKAAREALTGKMVSGISGLASLGTNMYSLYNYDEDSYQQQLDALTDDMQQTGRGFQSAETMEDLMNQRNSFVPLQTDYNAEDFAEIKSGGQLASGVLSGAAAGATAGSVAGPWGTAIGAVVGAGTSLVSGLLGNDKAREEGAIKAAEANRIARETNDYMNNIIGIGANRINQRNNRLMMMNPNIQAFGGYIGGNGGDWTDGLTFINTGGSHEQNPYGGVPMGIAPDGQPNLVEEGEVVWNDYVFSDRIKVPKKTVKDYKLKGKKDMTFAEAITNLQKSAEKRPNDPIEQQGLNNTLMKLAMEQEAIRQQQARKEENALMEEAAAYAADGGPIHIAKNKHGTFTAAATKHGKSVQEFASQVLANKENYSPAMVKKANFARNAAKWKHAFGGHLFDGGGFWKNGKYYNAQGIEQPNPFEFISKEDQTNFEFSIPGNAYYSTSEDAPLDINTKGKKNSWTGYSRYVPILGPAISSLAAALDSPNRTYSKSLRNSARAFSNMMQPVSHRPLANYLRYNPMDRMFYVNQMEANNAATRSAIVNNANANRQAAMNTLLAANYGTNIGRGELYRQAEDFNRTQKERVAEFNRGTDQYNATAAFDASKTNAAIAQQKASMLWDAAQKANMLDMQEDQLLQASRNQALTNLFNNIGAVGKESWIFKMIEDNPALMYAYLNGANGSMGYKGNNG